MNKNKKAESLPMQILIVAIILIVVAGIVIFAFKTYFSKGVKVLGDQTDAVAEESQNGPFGDKDNDGTKNMFDPCPCDSDNSKKDCEKDYTKCK